MLHSYKSNLAPVFFFLVIEDVPSQVERMYLRVGLTGRVTRNASLGTL